MSTTPQPSIGPASLPLASIDTTITTYRGQVFTARKSTGDITWIDQKTYKLGYVFLRDEVGIDDAELQAAMKGNPRRDLWSVFYAEMTIAKLSESAPAITNGHAADVVLNGAALPAATPTLQEQIAALQAENNRLRTAQAGGGSLSLKVSEKGALSVYGMGRFPTTLYREQWERLFAHQTEIQAFIQANTARLTVKAPK
jgi:hypothetical protein